VKPEIIKKAAGRAGRDIVCPAVPTWDSYERTLDVSRHVLEALTPSGAADFIDVYAFMRVTRDLS
jgi:hypothetical protein